ncbi:MAG: monofunctional biosynthetic peptidoglycan transglycosylase [Betaproteobacteria bacterium SG8_39]|nr:MAG: monofunctional biosynthetic peptidoglycan transglycosylase [Betaproteobacteria bacterium SG8_39]
MRVIARLAAFALLAGIAIVLVVQVWFLGQVLWLARNDPASTAFMDARLETLRARAALAGQHPDRARLSHAWVPYQRISAQLKRAVVAAEDARFLEHGGLDWDAIERALEKNQRRGRVVAGASTITQQLAKNLFLSGARSWMRKAQEAIIAWMLEATLSKRRILELYLNVAEWGEGVFGAQAAAEYHFATSAAALSAHQAAWLAAILPSPRRYARGGSTPYLERRVEIILQRMRSARIP